MKKIIVVILLTFSIESLAAEGFSSNPSHFRRNFATIALAGVGGAILGLSTLSFYGSPQDHVSNITSGFFLGLAGGAAYLLTATDNASANSVMDRAMGPPLMVQNISCRRPETRVAFPLFVSDFP